MAFTDDFAELYDDNIMAYRVALNEYGEWLPSGAAIVMPCRVEGSQRLFRNNEGQDVASTYAVYVGGFYNLSTRDHRFLLNPDRYAPGGEATTHLLTARSIEKCMDEDGPAYEVIYL